MDVTVTPAAGDRKAWDLADLLGRSMGRIQEDGHGRFTIQPDGRARKTMTTMALGPHPSLDAALAVIETHTRGVCRRAPEPTEEQP